MKIREVSSNFNYRKNQYKKVEKTNNVIQTQNQNISCPNSVLKAYSGVTFGAASTFYVLNRKTQQPKGIFNKITLDSGKSYDLRIGSDIISSYLSDGNGNVDDNRVKDFVSVYEQVLGHFVSKSEKEMEFLSEIAYGSNKTSKQSNIIYMNPNDEARQALLSTIMASEDDPLFSFFDKRFIKVFIDSEIDYVIWHAPYHFNLDIPEIPTIGIYDVKNINLSDFEDFPETLIMSTEE